MKTSVVMTVFSVFVIAIIGLLSFGDFELAGAQVVVPNLNTQQNSQLMMSTVVGLHGCGDLDSPNAVYALSGDVQVPSGREICFKALADGVTLDCQGHTVTGTQGVGFATMPLDQFFLFVTHTQRSKEIKVHNCNFDGFNIGVAFSGVDNGQITDTSTSNSKWVGFSLFESNKNRIVNNKGIDNHREHLFASKSSTNYISGNHYYNSRRMGPFTLAWLHDSDNNKFERNHLKTGTPTRELDAASLFVGGDGNRITTNTFENFDRAIYIESTFIPTTVSYVPAKDNLFAENIFIDINKRYDSVDSAFPVNTFDFRIDVGSEGYLTSTEMLQDATVTGGVRYLWEQVSGPGMISFGSPNSDDTTLIADSDGDYVVRLTAWNSIGDFYSEELSFAWFTPISQTQDEIKDKIYPTTWQQTAPPKTYSLRGREITVGYDSRCDPRTPFAACNLFHISVDGQTHDFRLFEGESEAIPLAPDNKLIFDLLRASGSPEAVFVLSLK